MRDTATARVAVATAMPEEAHRLADRLGRKQAVAVRDIQMWDGRIGDHEVQVVVTGIGKVASALAVQHVVDLYSPDWLLVTGVAGSARAGVEQGTFVVPERAVQWDVDGRPLTDRDGLVPGLPSEYFAADPALRRAAAGACARFSGRAPQGGTALTGDRIVASAEVRDRLRARYPDAACVDMETAAAAHTAEVNGVPWAAIRMVSDSADETVDTARILAYTTDRAAAELAEVTFRLIADLRGF